MSDLLLTIEHDAPRGRFHTTVDGQFCVLDYQLRDNIMVIQHTGVPEAVGGRGIAAQLTRRALDTARQQGWRVLPLCSYAVTYIARHSEYQDVLV